jgi:hypothetical protein
LLLEISKRFGGDCTRSALENRFRRIKNDAKLINEAIGKGIDPITLNVGDTDGQVAIMGSKISPGIGQATRSLLLSTLHITHYTLHFLLHPMLMPLQMAKGYGSETTLWHSKYFAAIHPSRRKEAQ